MDVRLINPFVLAIQRVFESMVHTKARIGRPVLSDDSRTTHDVSGVIGFSGDAAGCVVLSFPKDVACRVATKFAGIEIDDNHADFADAIGELANMVAGNAKTHFDGLNISISLPSVIMGGHTIAHPRQSPRIVIPCETDLGSVAIEVGMTLSSLPGKRTALAQGAAV
jgi:chemotaxis protein CheX